MAAHLGTHLSATIAAFGESDLLAAIVWGGQPGWQRGRRGILCSRFFSCCFKLLGTRA